jgi:uncharacterized protein YndB with AHSA1/START domain
MSLLVTTLGDRAIVLTRTFAAPRSLVFDAYTRPELLRRWYGAQGWQLGGCEVDLRIGGRYRFESHGPGGTTMVQAGAFRLVDPPVCVVLTELFEDQSYPGETVVTHQFDERAGQTTVTTTVRYATAAGRDTALRYPMARGVTESGDRLAALLAEAIHNREE